MVVEAFNAQDVRRAVLTARGAGLPFAVQSTGHGTHVAADGALLLKTSAMGTVLVDPVRRVARVGAGARWGAVLEAAAPFGLAPLSGSSKDVGVVGYTVGGGMGWLARRHGFAADSVLRAEVVLADGRVVVAGRDQYPDLFWALMGGGGNYGVVTALEFQLFEIPSVVAGTVSFSRDNAAETLAAYSDWAAGVPDSMSTAVVLRGDELVIKAMYTGPAASAKRLLRPLWRVAGRPVASDMRQMRYADAAMGGTAARYFDYFKAVPTSLADITDATVEVRHWAGAMSASQSAVGHRTMPFSVIVDNAASASAVGLSGEGGAFLNFLGDPTQTRRAYTADNYRRLVAAKRFYDPDNFFGMTHNIDPRTTAQETRAARSVSRGLRAGRRPRLAATPHPVAA